MRILAVTASSEVSPTQPCTNKPQQHLPVIKVTQLETTKRRKPQRIDPNGQIFLLSLIKATRSIRPTSSKDTALRIEEVPILGNIHI